MGCPRLLGGLIDGFRHDVNVLAGLLLVVYPISDAVATTAFAGLTATIDAFAVWAIVSGAIQLLVGLRRVGRLRGQWPMIISGAGSIFAGTTFIDWDSSPSSALHALGQYSIGGAIWYLLTALLILRTGEPSKPPSRAAPETPP